MSDVIVNLSVLPVDSITVTVQPIVQTTNVTVAEPQTILVTTTDTPIAGLTQNMLEFLSHVSVSEFNEPLWDGGGWPISN